MIPIELLSPAFLDGRGLYPERLAVAVPRGLNHLLREAARVEGVSVAEFVRRAVAHRVSMVTDGEKA